MIKNKLFAKYGHDCDLSSIRDELPMYRTGRNIWQQITNSCRRSLMTGDVNIGSIKYLKSQKNVEMERLKHLSHKRMIHPFSEIRQRWEEMMVIVFICVFIIIPFDLVTCNFPLQNSVSDWTAWKTIRTIFDFMMCADVIVNFCTGYWDSKRRAVVMEPKKVFWRYFCTFFIPDLFSAIPTHFNMFMHTKNSYIRLVLENLPILKIFRFHTFLKYCRKTCEARNIDFLKYRLLLSMFCYVLYFHMLTCFNLAIVGGTTNEKKKVGHKHGHDVFVWTEDDEKNDFFASYAKMLRSSIYLATFCFSSRVLFKYLPKIAYVIVWILSKVVTFYLISQFMEVVLCSRSSSRKYLEMVRELKEYMRYKQLPVSLQKRLIGYYEFKFQKSYFRESEILNIISGQLKQDLLLHSCGKLVEHVSFFQKLPMPLILRIISSLTNEVYMLNDVIIKTGTAGHCMYFILSGCVAIYTRNGYEVSHLVDGEYFGEYSLIKQQLREHSVVAVETCELYRLEQSDFIKVIMSHPDLCETITRHAMERLEMSQFAAARCDRRKRRVR